MFVSARTILGYIGVKSLDPCEGEHSHVELRQLRPPVESVEHVLLACELYRKLHTQLFNSVRDITSGRDADGRTVLSSGPVALAEMISTAGGAGCTSGRKSAVAIISGGLLCRRELNPRSSKGSLH